MIYVCGFCFDSSLSLVALARGSPFSVPYHGISGPLHDGDDARATMSWLFRDRTGMDSSPFDWLPFHSERFMVGGDSCTFLATRAKSLAPIAERKDACVLVGSAFRHRDDYNPTLRYLVPMARHWLLYPKQRYTEK